MTVKKFLVALALSSSLMGVAPSYAEEVAAPAVVEETVAAEVAAPVDAAPAEAPVEEAVAEEAKIDSGDTAWMLTATALVLFMTIPGLALFYSGMVRSKNVLSVMMQCFAITGLISILWVVYGYSLAFDTTGMEKGVTNLNSFVGGLNKAFLSGLTPDSLIGAFPESVFVTFQMTFAIITPALIVGAFAERMKFSAMLIFMAVWFTLVYAPMCHMVWSGDGAFLWDEGVLDFAGGTVVHINAGVAGLIGAALIALQLPLAAITFQLMGGSEGVTRAAKTYFMIRIWSAPLALANYVILGWLVGQARANLALALQIVINLINMIATVLLVQAYGAGIAGAAIAAVLAEPASIGKVIPFYDGDTPIARAVAHVPRAYADLS